MEKLQKIFEPIKIGRMSVKNRMVMPPMNTNFTSHNGAVTPQLSNYLIERAKGGVGLIVVEATAVVPNVKNQVVQPMLYDDSFIPSWGNLLEKLHQYGTKVSIQLQHSGLEATIGPRVSASDVPCREKGGPVIPLTVAEIEDLENKFVQAARRAKAAGFDAITWHAAHGYLIAQFLSLLYNKRTDAYGGPLTNRMRFLLEIIKKAKKLVGEDFPMMVRFCADEYIQQGLTLKESKEIARYLEEAKIHALDISGGVYDSFPFMMTPYGFPGAAGSLIHLAEEIKKIVNIPVIGVGGIRDPLFAEEILISGKADMVALGRTLIADPEFCRKAGAGNLEDIRKCISCQHCVTTLQADLSMRCAINPEVGREAEFGEVKESANLKKILIVGSGPGGMEAARIARLRGYTVMLFEKEGKLGGQLNVAKIPPYKEDLGDLIRWFSKQLFDLGVKVELNTEITPGMIEDMAPDVVILATGSVSGRKLPGSNKENVMTATDALRNPEKVGKNVVVIGGGQIGCETAEYLSGSKIELHFERMEGLGPNIAYKRREIPGAKAKNVTIVEMMSEIASELDIYNRPLLLYRLRENGVKIMTDTKVEEITDGGVKVINTKTLDRTIIGVDTVVLAEALEPGNSLATSLMGKVPELYTVGDCKEPRKIVDAIYEGHYVARRV